MLAKSPTHKKYLQMLISIVLPVSASKGVHLRKCTPHFRKWQFHSGFCQTTSMSSPSVHLVSSSFLMCPEDDAFPTIRQSGSSDMLSQIVSLSCFLSHTVGEPRCVVWPPGRITIPCYFLDLISFHTPRHPQPSQSHQPLAAPYVL